MSVCFILFQFFADKEVALGHHPSNKLTNKNGDKAPLVSWEPYFCVLLQDEQTFTAYRSEEMAVSISCFYSNFPRFFFIYSGVLGGLQIGMEKFYSKRCPLQKPHRKEKLNPNTQTCETCVCAVCCVQP
jgi:hypothetical protein